MTAALAFKADKTTTVNDHPLSGNVTVTKADIGLDRRQHFGRNQERRSRRADQQGSHQRHEHVPDAQPEHDRLGRQAHDPAHDQRHVVRWDREHHGHCRAFRFSDGQPDRLLPGPDSSNVWRLCGHVRLSNAGSSGRDRCEGARYLRVERCNPDGACPVTDLVTDLAGKQPLDTDLTAIAALTSAANKVPYATGAGTWALADPDCFCADTAG